MVSNLKILGLYGFSLFEMFLVNEYGRVFLLEKHIDRLFN